jgi:hypothetical protein
MIEVVVLKNLTALSLAVPHFAAVAVVAASAGLEGVIIPIRPTVRRVRATADPVIFTISFMYSG